MSATKNASERRSLESYQRVIGALDMQERLRREKMRLRNNAETAAERDGYQKDIDAIDKKIAYNDKRLIQMEAAAPIREIIKREVKANTEHDIDYIKKRDEQRRRKKQMTVLRNNIKNNSASLISMLKRPTNQRHVPEGLKEPVTRFLASIDFISQQADPGSFNTMVWQDNMNRLAVMLNNTNNLSDDNGAYNIEFDPDLVARMSEFADKNNGKKLTSLDMKQVEELYIIVRSLRMGISNANKMFANNRSADAQKLGYNTMQELSGKRNKGDRMAFISQLDKLFNTDMLDSNSYFKMLGEDAVSVYKELYDGWKTCRKDWQESGDYVRGIYKSMGVKQREINEWTGTEANIHKFDVGGRKLEMTTAQVMSLYELGKREQGRRHIFGDGITVDVIERRMTRKNKSEDPVKLGETDLKRITSVLTERQKQFADSLQSYLALQCAQKGNETSMLLYGYRKFNEKEYFPINVDKDYLKKIGRADLGNDVNERTIINTGMTKNLDERAEDVIIIKDIFDVYTEHVVDMANYHGFAAPITDALKWYNYGYKTGDRNSSVKAQISRVYGTEYQQYFRNLLLDINGDTARKIASNIPEKFTSAYKASAVGANLRVVVQQPTAYIRAAALIDPKYLVKALPQKSAYKEAIDNSVLAWWKSQGYYDTGLGQSLKSLVTGQQTFRDNVVEKSMWLAGKADELTWGKLWNAVKLEVADNNKSLDTSSEAYMKKVTERFEQIIDETQVVDTVFSKSQIMRSQNGVIKTLTAFMAEPIKSYNMLRNAALTKNPKKIAGAVSIFLVNSVATSAVSAVMDAMRALSGDEDKEKDFLERYEENFIKNFADNSNPLNLIPYIRDIQSVFEFTSFNSSASNRPEIAWISTLAKSCSAVVKCFDGSSNKPPMYVVKQCAKAASQISGIPAYNFTRELEAVYNTVKYDVFGKKPYDEVVREAAEARLGGDMDTYSSLVYELKDEGYELDDIIKKVNGNMIQIKKEQKEIEKQADSEEQAEDKEEKEQSMYNMSDVDTLLSSNDVLGANRVLNNLFNTELANADRGVKDYKYETYKKLRQKVRARLSKNYKKIESASEREKYGELLRQLTIEKLYIYNEKDIRSLEKAIAREAKEKQKNNL